MRKPHMRRRQNARSTIGRRASGLAGAAWAELRSEQELRALASEDVRHMTVATSPIAPAWHNTRLELLQNEIVQTDALLLVFPICSLQLLTQSCRLPGQRCGQHRCLRSAVVSTASLAELRFPVRLRQDLREAFADRRLPAWSYCSRPWCAKRTQGPKPQVLLVDAARTGTTPVFQPHMTKRQMRRLAHEEAPKTEAAYDAAPEGPQRRRRDLHRACAWLAES